MKAEPKHIIGDPSTWPVVTDEAVELVKVEVRPGVFIKMRKAEAQAKGLLPEEKAQEQPPNKKRGRGRNKGRKE